jgi:hypothetical protein
LADKSLARELRYQVHRNIVAMTRPSEGESVIEMEVEADESDLWLLATTIDPLFSLTSKSNEGQTLLVKVFELENELLLQRPLSEPAPLSPHLEAQLKEASDARDKDDPNDSSDDKP